PRPRGPLGVTRKACGGHPPGWSPALRRSRAGVGGRRARDPPSTAGERVFAWMDGREQARIQRRGGSAPIIGTCGTADVTVGWGEKVAYFQTLEDLNAGGVWYWDGSDHYTPISQSAWYPVTAGQPVYKNRRDPGH